MQPESPRVPSGQEQAPVPPNPNQEQFVGNPSERAPVLPTPETGVLPGGERYEQAAEARAATADAAAGPMMPPPLPQPLTPQIVDSTVVVPPLDTNPAIAADEDVIEKEWVDKAKQIIMETKDDPYTRTAKVNELQQDYLKKRYNKELGAE